jgi:hypothetical protein
MSNACISAAGPSQRVRPASATSKAAVLGSPVSSNARLGRTPARKRRRRSGAGDAGHSLTAHGCAGSTRPCCGARAPGPAPGPTRPCCRRRAGRVTSRDRRSPADAPLVFSSDCHSSSTRSPTTRSAGKTQIIAGGRSPSTLSCRTTSISEATSVAGTGPSATPVVGSLCYPSPRWRVGASV